MRSRALHQATGITGELLQPAGEARGGWPDCRQASRALGQAGDRSMAVPSIYIPGYQRARAANPATADLYLKHVLIGDPMADAVAASLSGLDPVQSRSFIEAGMDQQYHAMREVPQALRDFFQEISTPPDWYRSDRVLPGRKLFHRYSDLFMPAFFVVTLLNATTLISKGFYTTGRVLSGHAPQRIRVNTRHFIEIMLPGSLDRQGDGWKASVRIRLMHAHVRRLIANRAIGTNRCTARRSAPRTWAWRNRIFRPRCCAMQNCWARG